ncbi:unnamed protein product [Somion occarium]|uniref:Uncharacterized protein n=1 Tax=Somion occarium TaxID=3059160 RepID=A0ABP1E147_9APHY
MSQPTAGTPAELSAWLFFQLAAGHVGLPILVATLIFSKTARQHPTLVNVCLTYIISGVSSALLFYVGKHSGPEPGQSICVAQASLMDGLPIFTTTATLSLVLYLWKSLISDEEFFVPSRKKLMANIGLLLVPYLMFGIFVGTTVALSLKHVDQVNREQQYFYCSLNWEPLYVILRNEDEVKLYVIYALHRSLAVSILSTLACLVTLALEAHMIYFLKKYWQAIQRSGYIEEIDFHLFIRVGIFTLYQTASIVIDLVSIESNLGVLPQMFSASVSMVLFLLLASHPAIIQTWSFRRSANKLSLPWYHSQSQDSVPIQNFRATNASGLSAVTTRTGTSSTLYTKDYENKAAPPPHVGATTRGGPGVTIIGRPEDAFSRKMWQKQRSTISTWGF